MIVDGGWSDWTAYDDCSVTCGAGSQTRSRECDSPEPSNGGSTCVGDSSETTACEEDACLGKSIPFYLIDKKQIASNCGNINIQTSFVLVRTRYFISKGCPVKHLLGGPYYEYQYGWYANAPETSEYYVLCCNEDGTCLADSCINNQRKNFNETQQICSDNGGRLCTRSEMDDCCGKTGCERSHVWVGDYMEGISR